MTDLLQQEKAVFNAHKDEFLAKYQGKFVLIKGEVVAGVFDDRFDAIHQGYERFGNVPFLVKRIVEVEVPLSFTSNLFGA
jgi:hypothetical protein